jgi:two-component system, NarL family, nitrate/nitrite response regulator NarL
LPGSLADQHRAQPRPPLAETTGTPRPRPVRLLLCTHVRFYSEGLRVLFADEPDTDVIAVAAGAEALVDQVTACAPDVVLLDSNVPGSVAALQRLTSGGHDCRVIVLAIDNRVEDVHQWAAAGVFAFADRESSFDDLLAMVVSASRGEPRCSPRIAALLMRCLNGLAPDQPPPVDATLTEREIEIVVLIDQGLSNQQIAHRLHIALSTVKNHVHSILGKLQVRRRGEAAARARTEGLLVMRTKVNVTGDRKI